MYMCDVHVLTAIQLLQYSLAVAHCSLLIYLSYCLIFNLSNTYLVFQSLNIIICDTCASSKIPMRDQLRHFNQFDRLHSRFSIYICIVDRGEIYLYLIWGIGNWWWGYGNDYRTTAIVFTCDPLLHICIDSLEPKSTICKKGRYNSIMVSIFVRMQIYSYSN